MTTPGIAGIPGMMMTEDSEKRSSVYGGLVRTDSTNSLASLTLAGDAVLTQGRDVRAHVAFDYASDAIGERERERARKEREIDWAMNIDLEALEKNTKVNTSVHAFCFMLDDYGSQTLFLFTPFLSCPFFLPITRYFIHLNCIQLLSLSIIFFITYSPHSNNPPLHNLKINFDYYH